MQARAREVCAAICLGQRSGDGLLPAGRALLRSKALRPCQGSEGCGRGCVVLQPYLQQGSYHLQARTALTLE